MVSNSHAQTVVVLATLDTKLRPALDACDALIAHGGRPIIVDLSVSETVDVTSAIAVLRASPPKPRKDAAAKLSAFDAVVRSGQELVRTLISEGAIGLIGLGGGQGAALCSAIFDAAEDVPKALVTSSPRAQRWERGSSGLILVHSITDVSGSNPFLRSALSAAAAAVLAAAPTGTASSPLIAITMLGITTVGAQLAAEVLERSADVAVFHANGLGGAAMERTIRSGSVAAVLDYTTSELAAEVAGGGTAAGSERLTSAARHGLPQVVVPGGIDCLIMRDPEPSFTTGRAVLEHTADITLVRANADELRRTGILTAERLGVAPAPTVILIPELGFSEHDRPGGPFEDAAADAAYVDALRDHLDPSIEIRTLPLHINDPEFARAAARLLVELAPTL